MTPYITLVESENFYPFVCAYEIVLSSYVFACNSDIEKKRYKYFLRDGRLPHVDSHLQWEDTSDYYIICYAEDYHTTISMLGKMRPGSTIVLHEPQWIMNRTVIGFSNALPLTSKETGRIKSFLLQIHSITHIQGII